MSREQHGHMSQTIPPPLNRPPNLPSHLFPPASRPLQFNPHQQGYDNRPLSRPPPVSAPLGFDPRPSMGQHQADPRSAPPQAFFPDRLPSDKAIPDFLAAGYIPPPDMFNKPYPSEKSSFSFKDTIGKMLSKRKHHPDPHAHDPRNPHVHDPHNAHDPRNQTCNTSSVANNGKRTKFSGDQIRVLEHFYHQVNKYVTGSNKATLCQVTGLELNTVLMWFQNKRAREKKQKSHV